MGSNCKWDYQYKKWYPNFINQRGKNIAKGQQIGNFLYRMNVKTRKPCTQQFKNNTVTPQTFVANTPAQSWETWHRQFGHRSYISLQKLYDLKLVDGFNVDTQTPKPDCIACTEAKQHEKSFNKEEFHRKQNLVNLLILIYGVNTQSVPYKEIIIMSSLLMMLADGSQSII